MSAALTAPAAAGSGERSGRLLNAWWFRYAVAILAGLATGFAWQPYGLWPLLFVGLPAFTLVVRGVRLRRAFALGYLFGLAMLGVSINWIHVLGIWVAVALIVFEALFFAVLGLALNLVSVFRLWPLAAACCWSLIEFAYSRIPFGGFGWTRLAYAAVDTPLAGFFVPHRRGRGLVPGGPGRPAHRLPRPPDRRPPPGEATRRRRARARRRRPDPGGRRDRRQPTPGVPRAGRSTVGHGRGRPGQRAGPGDRGDGPGAFGDQQPPGRDRQPHDRRPGWGRSPEPDFILWPENSTDIDPLLDPVTRATVQGAAEVAGRPILVGAVMEGPGPDERQTAALWWDPQRGVVAPYDKRNLVPFGEWIPFRAELLPLVPILEKVGAQSVPGTKPGVLTVPLATGELKVGDIICFELAYDNTVYDTLTNGAQVLVVQSNNATYGGTGQIEQQFAITRARAMESRREIAVATTNSVSGFIDRDGNVVDPHRGVHRRLVRGEHAAAQRPDPRHRDRAVAGTGAGRWSVCWRAWSPSSSAWSPPSGAALRTCPRHRTRHPRRSARPPIRRRPLHPPPRRWSVDLGL